MLERFKHVIFAGIIVAIVGGIVMLLTYRPAPTVITIIPPAPTGTPKPLQIYVTGAVVNGQKIYSLPQGSRVQDAISAAGGISAEADLTRINLARPLSDGEQINVPVRNANAARPATNATSSSEPTPDLKSRPVHINKASLDELQLLPGVGPSLGQKILDYRNEHGPFKAMADLDKVSGIGPAKLKEWEGMIIFD